MRATAALLLPLLLLLLLLLLLCPAASAQGAAPIWTGEAWSQEPWVENTTEAAANAPNMPDLHLFNITGHEPNFFRLGSSEIPYSEYVTRARSSEMWVRDNNTWSQYAAARQGELLELVAYSPSGGSADLYRISYAQSTIIHKSYQLQPGYYSFLAPAVEPGRIFLILTANDQPSNALILDVLAPVEQPGQPVDVRTVLPGKARVTIISERTRGFDVYLDGVFYSSDLADGKLDGVASLIMYGGRTRTIIISERDGNGNVINKSEHKKDFQRDTAYTLRIS